MPGMSGLEFCKAFRGLERQEYSYFILLTSKSKAVASGLENGADDFLTKPVSADELRARLRAGERILSMQNQLVEKNRLVVSTFEKLQRLYNYLDRDLIEARKLSPANAGSGSSSRLWGRAGGIDAASLWPYRWRSRRKLHDQQQSAGAIFRRCVRPWRCLGNDDCSIGGAAIRRLTRSEHRPPAGSGRNRTAWPPALVATRLNRMMIEDLQVDRVFHPCLRRGRSDQWCL